MGGGSFVPFLIQLGTPFITAGGGIGPGWYAADEGLTLDAARPHVLGLADARRYWMDFAPLAEVVAGGVLAGTPTVTVTPAGGPNPTVPAVSGTRALVTLSGASAPGDYRVQFAVLIDGVPVTRSGWVRVV